MYINWRKQYLRFCKENVTQPLQHRST
jgi:hypothetical protein